MKRAILFTLFGLFFAGAVSLAQEDNRPEPLFVVVNQNQVAMTDMGALNKMWFEQAVPVLEELKEEGKLVNFGLMTHAWGDEWNYNFYVIAKSHEEFVATWDEYIKRMSDRHPDLLGEWISRIKAHKDNMYTVRDMNVGA